MKFYKITHAFFFLISCFFLFPLCLRAQDEENLHEDFLLPEYQVEVLNQVEGNQDVVFPFVFNGYLYSFALDSKLPLWRIFIGGDLMNPFIVCAKEVYFYDIYNRVYAVDLIKGKIRWLSSIDHEIRGKLLVYNNCIVASTQNGGIYVLNRSDGQLVYSYNNEGEISAGLTIYKNLIIVPYKNGKIVAYDIETRKVEWTFNAGGIISVSPVLKDDSLYFGSWDDTFYALDASTGHHVWISYVGDTITRDFLVFKDKIILFFTRGEMVGLSREKGDIEWVKLIKNVEFNYNYFSGNSEFFIFIPGFIALNPENGNMVFDYRERAFNLYKEMLFNNMVEGIHPLSDEERIRLLSDVYFTVNSYPHLPPGQAAGHFVYFITDSLYLYVYELGKNFFILKYKMS